MRIILGQRVRTLGVLGSLALLGLGCECGNQGNPSLAPCERPEPPPECNSPCAQTSPCPVGFYCTPVGICTAECLNGETCPNGGVCRADGRCGSADAGRSSGDVGPRPDRVCAAVTLTGARVTPNVVLLVDRSGSMNLPFEGDDTRWETVQQSLMAVPDGVVSRLESVVRFGLVLYTDDKNSSEGACPDSLITVPSVLDNFDAMNATYAASAALPSGETPTGPSIRAVLRRLGALITAPEQPTVFVLATDGIPDTCEDHADEVNGRLQAIEAVQEAFAHDPPIETFVVSVGTEIEAAHLQDLANAGVGRVAGGPNAPFWVATDTAGLVSALEEIVGRQISCTVELEGAIEPARACEGTVRLGDDALTCEVDWRATDRTHIELLGSACERLRSRDDILEGTFPCGVFLE